MIEIRSCAGMEEFDACVRLETETWGYDETEVIPRKTFLLAQKIGGQVIGAFDISQGSDCQSSLVGFAMSLPGIHEAAGKALPYLHSHMLAVREDYRNRGVGAQLKRAQRDDALKRGILHMEWTFDPLEIKNAFLNIHRLGAYCRKYRPDFYGVSSSRLQGGLPTDRLLAEWELNSPRVQACLDGRSPASQAIEESIMVPASIESWKANDTERALASQRQVRGQFQRAFERGLAVIGFLRDGEGNGIFELGPLPVDARNPERGSR